MARGDPRSEVIPANENNAETSVEGSARVDKQVTIDQLQEQPAAQGAELHRVGEELARVNAGTAAVRLAPAYLCPLALGLIQSTFLGTGE